MLVTKLVYSYEEVWVMLLGREKDDQAKSVLIGDRRDAMAKPAFDSKQGSTWVQMRGKLFDALARNIIRIMMQLDLSYTFELHMTAASGDYGGFKVSCQIKIDGCTRRSLVFGAVLSLLFRATNRSW